MKKIAIIIFLALSSHFSLGQTYSLTIDSLTKNFIDKLPEDKKNRFDSILKQRLSVDLFKRIDTTTFDYAFVDENYCYYDTSGGIKERYFLNNDSIPKYFYIDGIFFDPKEIYNLDLTWYSKNVMSNFALSPIIDNYSRLKQTQELPYNEQQIWTHGCIVYKNSKSDFEKRRTEQLKTTFQIQTMIDKKHNKIFVSIQYAPTRPKFKIYSYNVFWGQ